MAGFGFSIGDLYLVVNLAWTAYQRCKGSTSAYHDVGRDVASAHIVLRAIHRYWQAEEARGYAMSQLQLDDLRELLGRCETPLKDLEKILDNHKTVENRTSWVYKVKFAVKLQVENVASIRERLQEATTALATFNAVIVDENRAYASDEQMKILQTQAKILKSFIVRYKEYQDGARAEPAFSQSARMLQTTQDSGAYQRIAVELEEENIQQADIEGQQFFIKEWVEAVIPTDHHAVSDASNTGMSESTHDLTRQLTGHRIRDESGDSSINRRARSSSVDSHRSKDSQWEDPQAQDENYAVAMLSKVFRTKYPDDECHDLFVLPIKRIFYHLDWTRRGWILLSDVKTLCRTATSEVLQNFGMEDLAKGLEIRTDNLNQEVKLDEFMRIILNWRGIVIQSIETDAQVKSLKQAGRYLLTQPGFRSALPLGWEASAVSDRPYAHPLLEERTSSPPLQRNLTNAIQIAIRICFPRISGALRLWRADLQKLTKPEAEEYTHALDLSMKAATNFYALNAYSDTFTLHPFDEFLQAAISVPYTEVEDLADCPLEKARNTLVAVWAALEQLLSFTHDLWPKDAREVSSSPPIIMEWRMLRMLERSRRLAKGFHLWAQVVKDVSSCVAWYSEHQSLKSQMMSCIEETKLLKRQQYDNKTYRMEIYSIRIPGAPHSLSRFPSLFFEVEKDKKVVHKSDVQNKNPSPFWSFAGGAFELKQNENLWIKFYNVEKSKSSSESRNVPYGETYLSLQDLDKKSFETKKITKVTLWEFKRRQFKVIFEIQRLEPPPDNSAAKAILREPVPSEWEARRLPNGKVYFYNLKRHDFTPILWVDRIRARQGGCTLKPLPKYWSEEFSEGQVWYTYSGSSMKFNAAPEPTQHDTFETVLQPVRLIEDNALTK